MKISHNERRQIENEMIFRRANELVSDNIDELDAMHIEDNNPHLIGDNDMVLAFKCECSDEDCDDRISMKLSTYQKVHVNRDTFVVKLKHQVDAIETVIITESNYCVVEKNNSTGEPGADLNVTSINNR